MRLLVVDTIATVLFFTIAATFNELLVAGLEPFQVLTTRLIMVPVMVATGRPYAIWRDMLFRRLRPQKHVGKMALDIAAFLVFQVPVYVATLVFAGASIREITVIIGSAIVIMLVLSRPFGLFLELVREVFGIPRADS